MSNPFLQLTQIAKETTFGDITAAPTFKDLRCAGIVEVEPDNLVIEDETTRGDLQEYLDPSRAHRNSKLSQLRPYILTLAAARTAAAPPTYVADALDDFSTAVPNFGSQVGAGGGNDAGSLVVTYTDATPSITVTAAQGIRFLPGGVIAVVKQTANPVDVELVKIESIAGDILTLAHKLSPVPIATDLVLNAQHFFPQGAAAAQSSLIAKIHHAGTVKGEVFAGVFGRYQFANLRKGKEMMLNSDLQAADYDYFTPALASGAYGTARKLSLSSRNFRVYYKDRSTITRGTIPAAELDIQIETEIEPKEGWGGAEGWFGAQHGRAMARVTIRTPYDPLIVTADYVDRGLPVAKYFLAQAVRKRDDGTFGGWYFLAPNCKIHRTPQRRGLSLRSGNEFVLTSAKDTIGSSDFSTAPFKWGRF